MPVSAHPAEVLVLNGSPGAGKSTVANAVAERLRVAGLPHAVIDVDELARVFPETGDSALKWANLAAVWPNFVSVPGVKIVLPVLLDTDADVRAIRAATPGALMRICELTAEPATLAARVTEREPNQFWQAKLRGLVTSYAARDEAGKVHDFRVATDGESVDAVVAEVLGQLGWLNALEPRAL